MNQQVNLSAKFYRVNLLFYWLLVLLLPTAGCNRRPEIVERIVPQPAEVLVAESSKEKKEQPVQGPVGTDDRMLGAIFPQGEKVWFFKLTGPNAKTAEYYLQFEELIKSISFQNELPRWTLPPNWIETGEKSMFRYATLKTSAAEDALSCTVSELPNRGDYDAMTLENINRWRGQLGLGNMSQSELFSAKVEQGGIATLKVNEQEVRIVNLVGTMKKDGGGMQAPFMSQMNKNTAKEQVTPEPAPAPQQEDAYKLRYQPIKDWDEIPPEGFRRATFLKANEDKNLIMTVVSLKAMEGDLLNNINLWRTQLGLEKLTELPAQDENFQSITIADRPAHKVVIHGKNDQQKEYSIIAGILTFDNEAWFFKTIGDTSLAKEEMPQIDEFLKSVEIKKGE